MSSKSYQAKQAARLERAIATLTFKEDAFGLFALCPSTSDKIGVYSIEINASTLYAETCTCKATGDCIHLLAADRRLDAYRPTFKQQCNGVTASRETIDRLLEVETVGTIGLAMTEAAETMTDHISEAAIEGDKSYRQAIQEQIGTAYEQLGALQQPQAVITVVATTTDGQEIAVSGHSLDEIQAKFDRIQREHADDMDAEYTRKLSRQEYEAFFDPNGLNLG